MNDDRGNAVELCQAKLLPESLPRDVKQAVGWGELGTKRWFVSYAVGVIVGLGLILPFLLLMRVQSFGLMLVTCGGGIGVVLAVMIPMHIGGQRAREAVARAAMLRVGHCPSCGYDIRETRVESDGCKVCPECGGAWRLPAALDGTMQS